MRFLLLTGMSGAGKTATIRFLEDKDVFCVDNMPPMMIVKFMMACQSSLNCEMVAFSVDVRSGAFFDADAICKMLLETTQLGYHVETLFMEASDETLLSRFKETRREHPLASDTVTLTEAIAAERNMLQPLREMADYVIDTSDMKTKALRSMLDKLLKANETQLENHMRVEVMSFGFKRGLPREADLLFDVRFLPNPFYIPELCRHTGLDDDVRDFVMNHPVTQEFMDKICDMLDFLLPHYRNEGKRRIIIAIGCTGGAHRSVAITEAIGNHLRAQGHQVETNHRDKDIEQAHWSEEDA